mgnify:CR=1 FL=1
MVFWFAILAFIVGVMLYAFRSKTRPVAPEPEVVTAPAPAPVETPSPLPALENSDDFVRGQAAALSSNAFFSNWLKQGDLIARTAAAAHILAQGQIPRDSLRELAPRKGFLVRLSKKGEMSVDARSYARYNAVAAVVQSIDAELAAKLYLRLKPLFVEAERGLGETSGAARDTLVRAIDELLGTPVPEGDVYLKEGKKGILYLYADDALERLSPAQKQLLRMGPENEQKVKAKLNDIKIALAASGVR